MGHPARPARRAVQSAIAASAAGVLTLLGTGIANAAALPPGELRRVTDDYLYGVSLSSFISIRSQAPYDDQLDWSSDSCSWSPDQPIGYDFDPGCKRHDFGYRNYKLQNRFTEAERLNIDRNFRDDLYGICDGDWLCQGTADIYYNAVRQFGALSADTAAALRAGGVREQTRELVAVHEELERADTGSEAERLITDFEQENGVRIKQEYPVGR
ncbi:phospholipase [Streptomonospora litoralis]|uniref:Prokaryotic phospholipase A2 n=1 Tax=Streptomonospora litoralis TaxID=2498135 RepID=A0A4P6Q992_9ACTN|nr:phospholipase [Streptomonospora litoralis]QBI55637.1 Prokaryotic phospholipase A2 [Streptomonospora litoralis]